MTVVEIVRLVNTKTLIAPLCGYRAQDKPLDHSFSISFSLSCRPVAAVESPHVS